MIFKVPFQHKPSYDSVENHGKGIRCSDGIHKVGEK